MENNKLTRKLGVAFLIVTVLFVGLPVMFDFILIMNDKKTDFSFKHDYFILGGGLITGLMMILAPGSIVTMIEKILPK